MTLRAELEGGSRGQSLRPMLTGGPQGRRTKQSSRPTRGVELKANAQGWSSRPTTLRGKLADGVHAWAELEDDAWERSLEAARSKAEQVRYLLGSAKLQQVSCRYGKVP
jgi:hypothetical protein